MINAEENVIKKLFDLRKWIPEFMIDFIPSDNVQHEDLCFKETLTWHVKKKFTDDIKPIGNYYISVEQIGPLGHEFLVYMRSSLIIGDCVNGAKMISTVTEKFHCLQEKNTKYIYKKDGLHKKELFINIQDDSYHVEIISKCPCGETVQTTNLSLTSTNKLITGGTNILLMRYLAIINYQGILSFETIIVDGSIIIYNYICMAAQHMLLNDCYMQVYVIECKLENETKCMDMKTYLTPEGKILQHEWTDLPYIVKAESTLDANMTNEKIRINTPLRDYWQNDIEVLSKYLDKKSSKVAELTEYMHDHPEIKQLIADYVQTLLIVKPIEVLDFTIQHFKAFAKNPIPMENKLPETISDDNINVHLMKNNSEIMCNNCEYCMNRKTLIKDF